MKLDEKVIRRIVSWILMEAQSRTPGEEGRCQDFLRGIDLAFKPGDASQSLLVENATKNKEIDYTRFTIRESRAIMPLYEYKCPKCGREQAFLMKFEDPHPVCACSEGDPVDMERAISRT